MARWMLSWAYLPPAGGHRAERGVRVIAAELYRRLNFSAILVNICARFLSIALAVLDVRVFAMTCHESGY